MSQSRAAPAYVERKGRPQHPDELRHYDLIEMPRTAGRKRHWTLSKPSGEKIEVEVNPHISVNDPHTILALVLNGGGIGCLARYLCAPQIAAGKLVDLFPEWQVPSVDVSLVFPSSRELAPTIRAFVDFARDDLGASHYWRGD
jgi:DNA-binding transcriptional LysR family regulator